MPSQRVEHRGEVEHYTTTVTAQVAGTILKLRDRFQDGAFFKKDVVLAELEPADFPVAVEAPAAGRKAESKRLVTSPAV